MSRSTSALPPVMGLGLTVPTGKSNVSNIIAPTKTRLDLQAVLVKSSPFRCITSDCGSSGPDFAMEEYVELSNRKRKLDHLTLDEKIKRKKLKNRVAAQTSRDRKKLRMDELEAEIKTLKENNTKLSLANNRLQTEKEKLSTENVELREKLTNYKAIECCHRQSVDVACKPSILGPAVPPQPKGMLGMQLASGLENVQRATVIWKILTFFILSQISSQTFKKTNRLTNWKNLQQVCFETLLAMCHGSFQERILRLQEQVVKNLNSAKWWGPHQKTWTPAKDYKLALLQP